jgi:hypothetical protein
METARPKRLWVERNSGTKECGTNNREESNHEGFSMKRWLKTVAAKFTKCGHGRPAARPKRQTRLGLEALEARELLSDSPLVWTAPSTGPNSISLSVNAGQVQVRDNGVLKVSRAVTSTLSITLNADANVQNTFDILSTPQGIATTIQFSKPSGYSTATESVNVGNGSSVQGILGTLTIQGVVNLTKVTVSRWPTRLTIRSLAA